MGGREAGGCKRGVGKGRVGGREGKRGVGKGSVGGREAWGWGTVW